MQQTRIDVKKIFCEMCGEKHVEWICPKCNEDQIDYGTFYEGGHTWCEDCDTRFDVLKVKGIFKHRAILEETC